VRNHVSERVWHTKMIPHQASSPMKRPVGTQWVACGMLPTVAPWASMSRPVRTGRRANDDSNHQRSSVMDAEGTEHTKWYVMA
jgi:hypothetical protein